VELLFLRLKRHGAPGQGRGCVRGIRTTGKAHDSSDAGQTKTYGAVRAVKNVVDGVGTAGVIFSQSAEVRVVPHPKSFADINSVPTQRRRVRFPEPRKNVSPD
jgi:hypothetical protein